MATTLAPLDLRYAALNAANAWQHARDGEQEQTARREWNSGMASLIADVVRDLRVDSSRVTSADFEAGVRPWCTVDGLTFTRIKDRDTHRWHLAVKLPCKECGNELLQLLGEYGEDALVSLGLHLRDGAAHSIDRCPKFAAKVDEDADAYAPGSLPALASQRERDVIRQRIEAMRLDVADDDAPRTLDSDEHENVGYNEAIDDALKVIAERDGAAVPDPVEVAIAAVETFGTAWGDAESYEQQLMDARPLEKQAAILRIMQTQNPLTGKQHSASSADAIVEQDEQYRAFRQRQSEAVVKKFTARGLYDAARLRAERLVRQERAR